MWLSLVDLAPGISQPPPLEDLPFSFCEALEARPFEDFYRIAGARELPQHPFLMWIRAKEDIFALDRFTAKSIEQPLQISAVVTDRLPPEFVDERSIVLCHRVDNNVRHDDSPSRR